MSFFQPILSNKYAITKPLIKYSRRTESFWYFLLSQTFHFSLSSYSLLEGCIYILALICFYVNRLLELLVLVTSIVKLLAQTNYIFNQGEDLQIYCRPVSPSL